MTTVIGLGLDLVDLKRFSLLYGEDDAELLARCFTSQELLDAGNDVDRLERLAARFAAKEAVFKSLGGRKDIAHTDIEIVRNVTGAPSVNLYGAAAELATTVGAVRFVISLTHSDATAAAVALAMSEEPT